jgi:hypothetical protein
MEEVGYIDSTRQGARNRKKKQTYLFKEESAS